MNEKSNSVWTFIAVIGSTVGATASVILTLQDRYVIEPLRRDVARLTEDLRSTQQKAEAVVQAGALERKQLQECRESPPRDMSSDASLKECSGTLEHVRATNGRLNTEISELRHQLQASQTRAGAELSASGAQPNTTRKVDDRSIGSTAQEIDWKTTAVKWETNVGQRFAFRCPAGGQVGKVYGDDQYSTMSSVCSAAVHAARITAVDGGAVAIRMIGVNDVDKEGMTRAGVKSHRRNGQYPGFVFE